MSPGFRQFRIGIAHLCTEGTHQLVEKRFIQSQFCLEPLEFSAAHYTVDDLYAARHTHELQRRDEVILHLDAQQMGLGGASCGPPTLTPYVIVPGSFSFDVRLRPFLTSAADPASLAREALLKVPPAPVEGPGSFE